MGQVFISRCGTSRVWKILISSWSWKIPFYIMFIQTYERLLKIYQSTRGLNTRRCHKVSGLLDLACNLVLIIQGIFYYKIALNNCPQGPAFKSENLFWAEKCKIIIHVDEMKGLYACFERNNASIFPFCAL